MNKTLLALIATAALVGNTFALDYKPVADALKLPAGRPQMGNMHGDVAVSSNGEIYVSVMDGNPKDPMAGLQVYSPEGKYLRNVPNAPSDFHGFIIRKEAAGEFIYGPRLTGQTILKMTLDGKVVLEIPASVIPDQYKLKTPKNTKKKKGETEPAKNPDEGKPFVRLTGMCVAQNGDLYVTDGYASDYVHRFDKTGKYISSFGGKTEPASLKTLHKIALDTRFTPNRIIGADRENMRVVHFSLEGEFLGVVASDILRPAAVAVRGDYAIVGEIKGQVTLLDKAGKVVVKLGTNSTPEETATNKLEPAKWRLGMLSAPHGVAFNDHGDIFVSEYNVFGRVHRFNLQ